MGQGRSRSIVARQSEATLVHQPFRGLRRAVKPAVPPSASPPAPPSDPAALFWDAVTDVTRLEARARERVACPAPASPAREVVHPDAGALAELTDLVTGSAPFDITDTDEYIEGIAIGADPRLLRRLRGGEFAYQAHLDLHGMTSDEARQALEAFLSQAYQNGKRCVLIIHGRGRNSKDQIPILKSKLTTWLARGRWARLVLAFTSARPCDGGPGALYVLLRRQRNTKHPMRVTTGAKW